MLREAGFSHCSLRQLRKRKLLRFLQISRGSLLAACLAASEESPAALAAGVAGGVTGTVVAIGGRAVVVVIPGALAPRRGADAADAASAAAEAASLGADAAEAARAGAEAVLVTAMATLVVFKLVARPEVLGV